MAPPVKRRADNIEDGKLLRPRPSPSSSSARSESNGFFQGVSALFVDGGVSPKRLQIWKERFKDLGGTVVVEPCHKKKGLTHVLASDTRFISQDSFIQRRKSSPKVLVLRYAWIEDCLREGTLLACSAYLLEPQESAFPMSSLVPENSAPPSSACVELGTGALVTYKEAGNTAHVTECSVVESHILTGMNLEGVSVINNNISNCDGNAGNRLDWVTEDECQRSSNIDNCVRIEPQGLNEHITAILREMWDIYESVLGDEWRALTYRKAVTQLEKLPCRISTYEDVKHLPGIGNSMVAKIKEILHTGRLQKLENLKADSKVETLQRLASVWGVGPKLAQKLYQAGHRSVEDLVEEPSLSQMAQIGVRYHKDLLLRIPRDEVAAAETYVQKIASNLCEGICISVAGSYRRGKSTCGDIDFLATHPDGYSHMGFLVKLVEKLKSIGFITDGVHCTDHSSEDNTKVDTFMGIGRIPEHQHYRRLDIKVYPKECYAFALVYFTGNDILNRKLRYAAQRQGYKLNDQGLFMRLGGEKGISSITSIPCETEQEVFEKVGFPYYEPYDRNL